MIGEARARDFVYAVKSKSAVPGEVNELGLLEVTDTSTISWFLVDELMKGGKGVLVKYKKM